MNRKYKCYGCTACKLICPKKCIKMVEDNEGFKYPSIEKELCIKCNLCKKICPFENDKIFEKSFQNIYAITNKNLTELNDSTSGGAFTSIANIFCTDRYVIFGAGYDNNLKVKHIEISNLNDIYKIRGAKYVQSELDNTYFKVLNNLNLGKKVLFVGTPCQVAGLKSIISKKRINSENILYCDLLCHGVPSPKVYNKYKQFLIKQHGEIKNIKFRDKSIQGWNTPFINIEFKNGYKLNEELRTKNLYGNGFGRNIFLRPSCYKCKFCRRERTGDITLGDFWGIEKFSNIESSNGVSLVITNTNKGKKIIDELKNVIKEERNFEEAAKINYNLIRPSKENSNRKKFFKNLDAMEFKDLHKKYVNKIPLRQQIKNYTFNRIKIIVRKIL